MEQGRVSPELAAQLSLILRVQGSLKKWKKLAGNSKNRYMRLQELVSTEAQYLNDLQLIYQKIQLPLKESKAISQQEQKQMFPNISGMIHLSGNIFKDMEAILQKWDRRATLIGPSMIQYSKFMLVYSQFFKNYENTERKLKLLAENNQQAKSIEKNIVEQPRRQTFSNLMSKPFQRPLKYHLILKDYYHCTPKDHPDYKYLEKAMELYHEVNQRNNESMLHKEKNEMLVNLQRVFKDIISSQARYFITQSQAAIFGLNVRCYILSDMVLISRQEGEREIQYARIAINGSSFIRYCMKTRLLLCGKRSCIQLTFMTDEARDRFATYLNGAIIDLYNSDNFKQQVRNTRRTTLPSLLNSLIDEPPRLSETMQKEEISSGIPRVSLTQSSSMLSKPPRIIVLGPIKRNYSSTMSKLYFLTKFQMPFPYSYHQILYIEEEQLESILKITRILYFQERDLFDAPCLKELQGLMVSFEEPKSLEFKTLYYTLFLNTLFRHPQVGKRLCIYAHLMGIAQSFWLYLLCPNAQCRCKICQDGVIINTIEKYRDQLEDRNQKRKQEKTFYCPYRTFHVQDALLTMTSSEIVLGVDRLFWVQCEKGHLQYRLLDNPPLNFNPGRDISFYISSGLLPMKYEKFVGKLDRVGQIKYSLSKDIGVDLREYVMCMQINGTSYILGEDEILLSILSNEQKSETGFTGFFKNVFGGNEDNSIKLIIKRAWWFVLREQDLGYILKADKRIDYLMESMASRIKDQEIQLNIKDTLTFQACYLIYKGEKNVTEAHLDCLYPTKKWKFMNPNVKKDMLKAVQQKYQKLADAIPSTQGASLKRYIVNFLIKMLKDRQIWGMFMFEGTYQSNGQVKTVRVGFDLARFVVKEPDKVTSIFECNLTEAGNRLIVSSCQLRVKGEDQQYLIIGNQFAQMMVFLEMYIHYAKTYTLEAIV